MSMMNILYVWFPASWGPSAEAIQKRNETWLAQKPVIRDPQMFNRAEVTMGPASRELTYKMECSLRRVSPHLGGKCESRLACLKR